VGDTGIGKTLTAILLIQDFHRENAKGRWSVFLAPTRELVVQQAKRICSETGLRCTPFVGEEIDFWDTEEWQKQISQCDCLCFTPNVRSLLLARRRWWCRNALAAA
jgi:ERCC4-related helicase